MAKKANTSNLTDEVDDRKYNIIPVAIHAACARDKESKASMHCVLIDDGCAIATNAHIIVCYDLRDDLTEEVLEWLEGKMIHREVFAYIQDKVIQLPKSDKDAWKLGVHDPVLGDVDVDIKANIEDDLFPNYKKMMPEPLEKGSSKVDSIGFNSFWLDTIRRGLIKKKEEYNLSLKFNGPKRGILVKPTHNARRSYGIIMPHRPQADWDAEPTGEEGKQESLL
jgi:hypothetical protein